MKKIVAIIFCLSFLSLLGGCGGGDSDNGAENENSGGGEVINSEVHSIGEFDVNVPENWLVVPFLVNGDEENPMTDSVVLYKEAENDISMLNHPSISIFIYDLDHDALNDRPLYDDAEDIEPVVIGDATYEGFKSENNGYPIYSVAATIGDNQFKLIMRYKASKGEISFSDADVISIIESLTATPAG